MRRHLCGPLVAALCLGMPSAPAFGQPPAESPPAEPPAGPSALTRLPELSKFVEASHPPGALADRVEATVALEIDIEVDGKVSGARVAAPTEPAGHGFDEAAIAAVLAFEFEPALAGGQPVAVTIRYEYHFRLGPEKMEQASQRSPDAAAEVSVRGRLVDSATGKPAAEVTVTVMRGSGQAAEGYEVTSDEDGRYSFAHLQPGPWLLIVDDGRFALVRKRIVVSTRGATEVDLRLAPRAGDYDVLVEAERKLPIPRVFGAQRDEATIPAAAAKAVSPRIRRGGRGGRPGGGRPSGGGRPPGVGGPPAAAGARLSGFTAGTDELAGGIVVHGADPHDATFMIEGARVPSIYHFGDFRAVLPETMIGGYHYQPFNFSVFYGRATAGILDVSLQTEQPEQWTGYLDVNTADGSVFAKVPVTDRAFIAGGVRASYLDVLYGLTLSQADVVLPLMPRYQDFQLRGRCRIAPNQTLDAMVFGFHGEQIDPFAVLAPVEIPSPLSAYYGGMLKHRWALHRQVTNEIRLSLGLDDRSDGFTATDVLRFQARDVLRVQLSEAFSANLGLDYLTETRSTEAAMVGPPVAVSSTDGVAVYPAGHLELEIAPTELWLLVPGVRVDYFGRVEQITVDPRLTTRLRPLEQLSLKAGVGLFHQEPTVAEIGANPELETEMAVHTALGVDWSPVEELTLGATGFFKWHDDLTVPSSALVEREGQTVVEGFNNSGVGRTYGGELSLRVGLGGFDGWAAYTLSRAERGVGQDPDYDVSAYDQTHVLTLHGRQRLPEHWSIRARWRYATGLMFDPVVGSVFASDLNGHLPIQGAQERLPDYHELDVRIDKRWRFEIWHLTAYLDVRNVYNRANVEGYAYSADFSQSQEQIGLPTIIMLGLQAGH